MERNPATVEIKVNGCGVNFSRQNFQQAQIQNCESKKHARSAPKTAGDSGEGRFHIHNIIMENEVNHRIKVERPFNPHRLLLACAQRHLKMAKENKEKGKDVWEYDWLGAIVFSALSIEAIGNGYGTVLIPNWKDLIHARLERKEGASPIWKLTFIAKNRGITPNFNSHPWLTLKKLTKFRDCIAHADRKYLEHEEDCTESDCARVFGARLLSDVEKLITEDFATESCDAVDWIMTALNETLDGEGKWNLANDGHARSAKIINERDQN